MQQFENMSMFLLSQDLELTSIIEYKKPIEQTLIWQGLYLPKKYW